jgi:hypothetical protein
MCRELDDPISLICSSVANRMKPALTSKGKYIFTANVLKEYIRPVLWTYKSSYSLLKLTTDKKVPYISKDTGNMQRHYYFKKC